MFHTIVTTLKRVVSGEAAPWSEGEFQRVLSKTGAGAGPDAVELIFVFPEGKEGFDLYQRLSEDAWRHGLAVHDDDNHIILSAMLADMEADVPAEWAQEDVRRVRVRVFQNFVPEIFWEAKGKNLVRIEIPS